MIGENTFLFNNSFKTFTTVAFINLKVDWKTEKTEFTLKLNNTYVKFNHILWVNTNKINIDMYLIGCSYYNKVQISNMKDFIKIIYLFCFFLLF